jgi:tetratricopeptide (TPR) repeat protein
MARDNASEKYEQSSRIRSIGCFGIVLVIILLVLIGLVAVRSDISKKRADALTVLGRMREQVDKAPDILNRMLVYDCGSDAEFAVSEVESVLAGFPENPTLPELNEAWDKIENARTLIGRGCRGYVSDPAFVDLNTEMEGAKNRYSVEKGNYIQAAEIYNEALDSFPGYLLAAGFRKL